MIAFLFLYGESGLVTRSVQRALGMAEAPWRLQGVSAIVFVHAYTMYVYVFLFVSAGLERFDATLDEAASGLGANTGQRLRRVTLPLLMPAVAGSMLLVFMNSLGSFSAPYVFGGGLRVLSTQILASKINGAMGLAYVETTVLALSAVAGLLLFRWIDRKRKYTLAGKGGRTRRVIRSRRAADPDQLRRGVDRDHPGPAAPDGDSRLLCAGWSVDDAGASARVHARELSPAFLRSRAVAPDNEQRFDGAGGDGGERRRLLPRRVSHRAAAGSPAGGCSSSSSRCRGPSPQPRSRSGSPRLSTENDLLTGRVLLVGTFWILPLAYFIRDIPLVASAVEGSLRQMDPSLEDAARGLGASWMLTMRRVILPAARPGLVAGALLAAVTAVGRVRRQRRAVHAREPADLDGDSGPAPRSRLRDRRGVQRAADPARAGDDSRRQIVRGKACLIR